MGNRIRNTHLLNRNNVYNKKNINDNPTSVTTASNGKETIHKLTFRHIRLVEHVSLLVHTEQRQSEQYSGDATNKTMKEMIIYTIGMNSVPKSHSLAVSYVTVHLS